MERAGLCVLEGCLLRRLLRKYGLEIQTPLVITELKQSLLPQTVFSVSHSHLAVDHSVVQYPVMKCVICMVWYFSAYLPTVLDKETGDRAV